MSFGDFMDRHLIDIIIGIVFIMWAATWFRKDNEE